MSSISAIRPSIKLCFSLAAWYSAFSERSPFDLASAIAFIISGLSTVLSVFNSSMSLFCPFSVIGILSIFKFTP